MCHHSVTVIPVLRLKDGTLMKLPKKITPCPIIDAIVEIRYSTSADMPSDAIFGLAYDKLHTEYPQTTNLPAMQVPEQIRLNDPKLKFQAHHKFSNDKFSLSIGPRVLVFSCHGSYPGWHEFFPAIKNGIHLLGSIEGMIDGIDRLGVRFVNFFNEDLSENIEFEINTPKLDVKGCQFHTTLVIPDGKFKNTVQVANKAHINIGQEEKSGAIVDIDTYKEVKDGSLKEGILELIDEGHTLEKKIFYSLFKEKSLEKFNPTYEY